MAFKKEGKKFGGKKPFSRSSSDRPSYGRSESRPSYGESRSYGGARSFDRKPSRGNGIELFDAVCESCGKDCQLPFKPTGGKPVYCRNCFNNQGEAKTFSPRQTGGSDDLQEINRKLDKIMRALKID